jgi:hypothetical protein
VVWYDDEKGGGSYRYMEKQPSQMIDTMTIFNSSQNDDPITMFAKHDLPLKSEWYLIIQFS